MKRAGILVIVLVAIATSLGRGEAGSAPTSLGPPMAIQSTSAYFPLSGFHRVSTFLRHSGKPELLMLAAIGTYPRINIERWAVAKALDQFGTLSGVKTVDKQCTTIRSGPNAGQEFCTIPTFDFSRARYSSRYLAFVSKDLIRSVGTKQQAYQSMTVTEQKLYDAYVKVRGTLYCYKEDAAGNPIKDARGNPIMYRCNRLADYVNAAATAESSTRTLPLLAVGGYIQTLSQDVTEGDFSQIILLTPPPSQMYASMEKMLSFSVAHDALAAGKDPFPGSRLVEDVNAEANIVTAIVCHATRGKPQTVCGRPTIKAILKHVK